MKAKNIDVMRGERCQAFETLYKMIVTMKQKQAQASHLNIVAYQTCYYEIDALLNKSALKR